MVVPGWVDPVAKVSEIVGAVVGLLAYVHDTREKRRAKASAALRVSGMWPRIAMFLCVVALAALVLQLTRLTTHSSRTVTDVVAISAASGALMILAVYVALRRRQLLPLHETLRTLIDRQHDEARRHTYKYTVGTSIPPLPDIYVEQHTEAWVPAPGQPARLTLDTMLRENHNAVVIAEPGVGKSTAIAKVLWEQCDWLRNVRSGTRAGGAPYGSVIPIALPPDLHGCDSVAEGLAREWERLTGSKPGARLFESRPPLGTCWLILVDGLDQVLDISARQRVLELLGEWATGNSRRLMITTRPLLGWELSYLKAESFGFFRLAKFDSLALRNFAERWEHNRSDNPIYPVPVSAAKFLACVRSGPLAPLVYVPLIATITYLLLEAQGDDQPLPASREALYERYVVHLLSSRGPAPAPAAFAVHGATGQRAWSWCTDHVRALLEGTADLSLTIGAPTVHDCAVNWIKSQAPQGMFDELPGWEDGLDTLLTSTSLVVPDRGKLGFAHPSFAEYLAAGPRCEGGFDPEVWLADAISPDSLSLALFVLSRRCRRAETGLADRVVELLLDRGGADACTAGEVIADGIGISPVLRSRVIDYLIDMLTVDDLDTGAALRVLATLAPDPTVGDRLDAFASDPGNHGWVRADVADQLCNLDRERGARLLRKIHEQTSDTWLRRRILLKVVLLGVASDEERARADYEFTIAQSGPATTGERAGEWFRQEAESATNTPAQRLSAALALAERRDDGWQSFVVASLADAGVSSDNRFQAARRLAADPQGTRLLERLADQTKPIGDVLDVVVPVLAALSSFQNESARQRLNELQRSQGEALAQRFPLLDSWREEIGQRSYSHRDRLPSRDQYFVGREAVLKQIHAELAHGPVCLVGTAGIGKTAIAREYSYRYADEYEQVVWMSGVDAKAASALSPLVSGRSLLIIDNVNVVNDLSDFITHRSDADVMITVRETEIGKAFKIINVGAFSRSESVTFLRSRLSREMSPKDTGRLAILLEDIPLALDVAAATIASGMRIDEYVRRLEGSVGTSSSRSLALSLAVLREENPVMLRLLECCAAFAVAPIPLDIFESRVRLAETDLAELINDKIRFNRAVTELGRLSLIASDKQEITVHEWVRSELSGSLNEVQREERRQEAHLLLAAAVPSNVENPGSWPRFKEVLPHLLNTGINESDDPEVHLLALRTMHYLRVSGNPKIAVEFAKPLLERARRTTVADALMLVPFAHAELLRELGHFREAVEIGKQLGFDGQLHGAPVNLTFACARGSWLRVAGRFADALDYGQYVRQEMNGRVHGDPQVMQADINTAIDLILVGNFQSAEQTLKMATGSIWTMDLLRGRIDLATALRLRGHLDEARRAIESTSLIFEQLLNREHPLWLQAARERSIIERFNGHSAKSFSTAQESFIGLTRVYGENHLEVLAAAVSVTNSARRAGGPSDPYTLATQTVQRYTEVLGPDHPFTLSCKGNLAILLRLRGDLSAARDLNEGCLAGLREAPGIYALTIETNLASDLAALGERDAAVELGAMAVAKWTTAVGGDHPFTKACAANLTVDVAAAANPPARHELDFDPPRI